MKDQTFTGHATDLEEQVRQLGRMLSELEALETRASRVHLTPGEVVYRDPHDAFHHITSGAVLSAHGLSAHYARRLDGFLSLSIGKALEDKSLAKPWTAAFTHDTTIGEALRMFFDAAAGQLEASGRHAEWRRRYEAYMAKTDAFFAAADGEMRAAMERKPASRKQASLVRYTCECLRLDYPELPNRWAAFEWLRAIGANPRYREVRP